MTCPPVTCLTTPTTRFDIEDAFSRYGRVRDVWVARKPPGFAFLEMEDRRDAEVGSRNENIPVVNPFLAGLCEGAGRDEVVRQPCQG